MIEIRDLKKIYNSITVVDIPRLEIKKGETIGLVGNNGAGKTTLFRIMLDLVRSEQGEVLINQEVVASSEHWKDYVASYLDEGFLIDYLTPEEYFYFIGSLHNINKAEVDAELEKFVGFFNGEILHRNKYIRDLSKGNQSKVGVVSCFLQHPQVLLLDEPFANIDPSTQIRLKAMIKQVNQDKNKMVVISSHDLNHVTEVCDRILLMEKGKIIKDIQTNTNTQEELEKYFSVMI
jgi:ABC-2 type transport system ATP-binding protein